MSLRLALYQERRTWRPGEVFQATLEATNLSASTHLDLRRLACELVGLEIVDRARVSPSYAASGAPDAPDRTALAWPPPALLAAVVEEDEDDHDDDDDENGKANKRPAAAPHPAASFSSVPSSSRGDARRIVSPPVLLLVGKLKKKSKEGKQEQQNDSSSSSPPFSLGPLSSASWSVSLRLPPCSPATLRGGPGSPVRYNYRIQALARYRQGERGGEGGGGEAPPPPFSLAAAAVAVRVLPPLSSASAAGSSGLLTGAAAEPAPCRYEPGALIKGLPLVAERLPDDEESSDEDSSHDSEEEEKKKKKKSTSARRPFSSSSSAKAAAAPSLLLFGGGLVSLSPARRQQHPRPSTAGGGEKAGVVTGGGEKPALVPLPPPPPPAPTVVSARSFNLRAPGGTLARLTLHGPPDGLPLTPGATLRGTLDLRPPQQQAPRPAPSSSSPPSNDDGGKAERKEEDPTPPPPICARFAVSLESVEAVASKWAIRGAVSGGKNVASRRVVSADEAASACAHLRLAHFELTVPPDAPLSQATPLVSVRWALRLEMAASRDYDPNVGQGGGDGAGDDEGSLWARSPSSGAPATPPPAPPRRQTPLLPPPPLLEWELPIAVVAPTAAFDE